jgi:hypothetical protein
MNLTASHITATGALGHFELPAPVVGARRTLTPAEVGTAGPIGTWNLPQEIIVNILDPEVDQAPGLITVQVSLAPPGAVLFYIDGAQVWADTATDTGVVGPLSLSVDEDLAAGDHVLSVTASGATGADHFTIAQSPAILPAPITPDPAPTPVANAVKRWVLQDLLPGGLGSWVLDPGPASYEPIPTARNLQVLQSTYSGGKSHVSESRTYALAWSFAGYCPDRAYYDQLVAYGSLRRRIYVIDHRNRAWTCVPLGADLVPRKRQLGDDGEWNDWAHNYTMRFLLFDTGYQTVEHP